MRLIFTEQGDEIGVVELVDGDLTGPPAWVRMVHAEMQRSRLDTPTAMRRLDGWSNGYLRAQLDQQ